MLDKYKDKNEFYSLVGIKCYSYVPSLINKAISTQVTPRMVKIGCCENVRAIGLNSSKIVKLLVINFWKLASPSLI
ncbi:hypothetical protein [Spiroplasma endosymbiont of Tipula paludosa]|uniref:hypothetical protein n=1 Tax=Spiroplasma endosymbiont of Tipula paludosa TaxID=3066295 RepID=UPI0035C913CD